MTGGIIQLVALGIQDIFLTRDPQITFFKVVYRRHTNFSIESIQQNFLNIPNFGRKSTSIIAKNGDLVGQSSLVVVLPAVPPFTTNGQPDNITKFAWVRKIGYALIESIEVEINGQIIDRQYGEWLSIWSELTDSKYVNYNTMIGNVEDLFGFSNGKDSYTLYIPLKFWFCKSSGLALPIVSLLYSEVKVNIEISDLSNCYVVAPSNTFAIENTLAPFKQYEYITQAVSGAQGIFINYDMLTQTLYYLLLSPVDFVSEEIVGLSMLNAFQRIQQVYEPANQQYTIVGQTTGTFVMPEFSDPSLTPVTSSTYIYNNTNILNLMLTDCYLLVDYIFLDEEERIKFVDSRHDYLIEQLETINDQVITSTNTSIFIDVNQPSKLFVWIAQFEYIIANNDFFNYTNSPFYTPNNNVVPGTQGIASGTSLITQETILLNGNYRLSDRPYNYFNYVQPYQHFPKNAPEGFNIYSFSLLPDKVYPSGSCNMSQIDNIQIQLNLIPQVSISTPADFRLYSYGYNVLRIVNGLSGLVFADYSSKV